MSTIIYYCSERRAGTVPFLSMREVEWDFPHYQFSFNANKDSPDFQKFYDKALTYLDKGYKPYRIENPSKSSYFNATKEPKYTKYISRTN